MHIIVSNTKDAKQMEFALNLESELESSGVEVLLDDRNERFGVKMADFDLIGVPFGVVVGKGLQNSEVELIIRDGLEKVKVSSNDILGKLKEII